MVFAVLRICSGAKTLKNCFGCSVPDTSTFLDVYCEFSSGNLEKGKQIPDEYNTVVAHVSVQKSTTAPGVDVQPTLAIVDVITSLGIYVEYWISSMVNGEDVVYSLERDASSLSSGRTSVATSAFALLMNAVKEKSYRPPLLLWKQV